MKISSTNASFLLSNYVSVDLLKLEGGGEEENNSIFAIIHLRVPSLEDLDNGNRVWYIAGLTLEPPLFIKSRSCYWIFPGNKNIGANRRLSPEEENEKFITDSRRCVHFEFICRKIFIDHRAWLMNRWISIDATLINHPRKKRELNRASRIPRSANNGIFP